MLRVIFKLILESIRAGRLRRGPLALLILANLVPLYGVMSWGWDIRALFLTFWVENVIIGVIAILKILNARQNDTGLKMNGQEVLESTKIRGKLAAGFSVHFSIFTLVHGFILMTVFGLPDNLEDILLPMLAALTISHYLSYRFNYIGGGENERTSPGIQMFAPYPRVFIMHFLVLFGGMFITWFGFGGEVIALMVLIGMKIILDILSHIVSHAKLSDLRI